VENDLKNANFVYLENVAFYNFFLCMLLRIWSLIISENDF